MRNRTEERLFDLETKFGMLSLVLTSEPAVELYQRIMMTIDPDNWERLLKETIDELKQQNTERKKEIEQKIVVEFKDSDILEVDEELAKYHQKYLGNEWGSKELLSDFIGLVYKLNEAPSKERKNLVFGFISRFLD